ncbi:hypothetical protein PM082_020190 [Marasmius tenuissimus]|nr:hypothetical protein PM082_020190 [Marasmius tenuissimus]
MSLQTLFILVDPRSSAVNNFVNNIKTGHLQQRRPQNLFRSPTCGERLCFSYDPLAGPTPVQAPTRL